MIGAEKAHGIYVLLCTKKDMMEMDLFISARRWRADLLV